MTPMIDVVFLLIIFFLVSSHLARVENRLPVDLPDAITFGVSDVVKPALTITVDDSARILVAGKEVDKVNLHAVMEDLKVREGDQAALRIRSDKSIQYRYVEPVLRAAAQSGVTDISLAVQEGQE